MDVLLRPKSFSRAISHRFMAIAKRSTAKPRTGIICVTRDRVAPENRTVLPGLPRFFFQQGAVKRDNGHV